MTIRKQPATMLGKGIGVVACSGFALVILMVTLLPETRGKALAVYD